jgi:hypothetical protein
MSHFVAAQATTEKPTVLENLEGLLRNKIRIFGATTCQHMTWCIDALEEDRPTRRWLIGIRSLPSPSEARSNHPKKVTNQTVRRLALGTALQSQQRRRASPPAIRHRLWRYWGGGGSLRVPS